MLDAHFECIESDDQQSWLMFHRQDTFGYYWHFHPQFEVTLIVKGGGTRFVGDSIAPFGIGDLVLMGPNLPHTYYSDGAAASLCCQFSEDLLGTGWTERPEWAGVARLLARSRRGVRFAVDDLEPWWETLGASPARRTHRLLGHLIELAERADGEELASADHHPQLDERTMTRLDVIMRYIEENLAEPLRLDDVAAAACLSPSATSRFFRRQTGYTITEHINRTRVAAACRMLTGTTEPVGRIAWDCGFGNLSNFHRQFRRITGVTPVVYRASPTSVSIRSADLTSEDATMIEATTSTGSAR